MGKTHKGRDNSRLSRKIEKKKLICYVYGKEGHKSYQCHQRKGRSNQKPVPQANLAAQDDDVIVAIAKVNLIENKTD